MIGTGPEGVRRRLLKVAAGELVHQVGGIEAAAATLDRGKSGVGRWVNRNEPDFSIPVHEAARLEQLSDRPVLTEALCRLAGGLFVPHLNPGADEGTAEWLAMGLAKELGEVSGAIVAALSNDRQIDAGEAAAVKAPLERLLRCGMQIRQIMDRIQAEGEA